MPPIFKPTNTCLHVQRVAFNNHKPCLSHYVASKHGFSMIELMVSVGILGIIAMLATPSLNQAIRNARVRADAEMLQTHLSLARRYALSNGTTVHLCQRPISGTTSCDNNYAAGRSWRAGWLVFADDDKNNTPNNEEMLKIMPPLNATNIIFNQQGRLRFFSDGSARSAGFYICSPDATAERYISVLHSGRVRISDKLPNSQQGLCKIP